MESNTNSEGKSKIKRYLKGVGNSETPTGGLF